MSLKISSIIQSGPASPESPQTNLAGISVPGFVSGYTPGGLEFAPTSTYSSDLAPDVIGKLAFDPGYGHYEVFGITRFFHDYVPGAGGEAPSPAPSAAAKSSFGDNDAVGFGGGAGVIVPVCPKILDFQGNFMAGQGLGRYGSAQLPDIAFSPTGEIKPLTYWSAMGGFVGHPLPCLDAYVYAGYETVDRQNYTLPAKSIGTSYNFTDIGYGDFDRLSANNRQRRFGKSRAVYGTISIKALSARCRSVCKIP